MKLKNKKTGEIGTPRLGNREIYVDSENHLTHCYKTLSGVYADWEEYEERNIYYFIDIHGQVKQMEDLYFDWQDTMKQIGNYFKTKEEAEKAVEKLKALKRLKDKGLEFNGWTVDDGLKVSVCTNIDGENIYDKKIFTEDLDLLFGC